MDTEAGKIGQTLSHCGEVALDRPLCQAGKGINKVTVLNHGIFPNKSQGMSELIGFGFQTPSCNSKKLPPNVSIGMVAYPQQCWFTDGTKSS